MVSYQTPAPTPGRTPRAGPATGKATKEGKGFDVLTDKRVVYVVIGMFMLTALWVLATNNFFVKTFEWDEESPADCDNLCTVFAEGAVASVVMTAEGNQCKCAYSFWGMMVRNVTPVS